MAFVMFSTRFEERSQAVPNAMFFDVGIALCAWNMTVLEHVVVQLVAKHYVSQCFVLLLRDSL